jgi:hypothetical protein
MNICQENPNLNKFVQNIVPFTQILKYVPTTEGHTKYFLDWQQYKGNCYIFKATIKLYITDSDTQHNTMKRTHDCVTMAVLTIFIKLHAVTYVAQQYK